MVRTLIVFFIGSFICASFGTSLNAQEPSDVILSKPIRGTYCCYVIGVRTILIKGRPVNEYKGFCCAHSECENSCNCAIARMLDETFAFDSRKGCVPNCVDLDCEPSRYLTASNRFNVQLLCCGCDGVEYVASGSGSDFCAAFNQAKRTAMDIGCSKHGGLKSCCVLEDTPSCQPVKVTKPRGILHRLFHR